MVSLAYENGVPVGVKTVVVSAQHAPDATEKQIRDGIIDCVVKRVIPDKLLRGADILINPTGRFVVGGPAGDTGVTGRKIIVDTYGGAIPHGGGAFSGKDASKVDRSASYYARYVCKTSLRRGLRIKRCCRSVTQSARLDLCRCISTRSARATIKKYSMRCKRCSTSDLPPYRTNSDLKNPYTSARLITGISAKPTCRGNRLTVRTN